MSVDHRSAWSDFWAQNQQSGSGCLPKAWQGIDTAQREAWAGFARKLPKNARVLDLATGDGLVLRWLGGVRSDLSLLGVDLADRLPAAPRGTKIRSGVAMERLPLPDGRFSVVVSQFGFEYSDLPKSAKEVARVLRKDGIVGLITHRQDGPILAYNLDRRDQIRWVLEDCDLPAIARRSLSMPGLGTRTIPPAITQAPAEGAQRFGPQSAAWEIAEAIRQTLVLGQRDAPGNVIKLIETITAKAGNELARIASLEAACGQTADEAKFTAALEEAGLHETERSSLHDRAYPAPFADFRLIRPR